MPVMAPKLVLDPTTSTVPPVTGTRYTWDALLDAKYTHWPESTATYVGFVTGVVDKSTLSAVAESLNAAHERGTLASTPGRTCTFATNATKQSDAVQADETIVYSDLDRLRRGYPPVRPTLARNKSV